MPVHRVEHWDGDRRHDRDEPLAVEEPLEIRIVHGLTARRMRDRLTVTLRTPGHDEELATGLLFSEGVMQTFDEILSVQHSEANVIRVELAPSVEVNAERFSRTFASTASCGLCGKTMLEWLEVDCEPIQSRTQIEPSLLHSLPLKLRESQTVFQSTGGVHAAALFDNVGQLLCVREDVGRHNAVDKLIGACKAGTDRILLVSGRAGYELVQKAARFGVPIMAAVGAPTSLAVELAERLGVTLAGFVRDGRANVYTHPQRIRLLRDRR
jgi:FdhD protein